MWSFVTRIHIQKMQMLLSNYLRLATVAPWYISGRQIYEDLGVLLFVDHIRDLTASLDSKLADLRYTSLA
jgi:hypothetical protein